MEEKADFETASSSKVKWTALSGAFLHLHGIPKCFTSASRSPIHTLMGDCCHARHHKPHWEQLGFCVLPMDTSASGDLEKGFEPPTLRFSVRSPTD